MEKITLATNMEPQVKDSLSNHFVTLSTKITLLQDEKNTNTGLKHEDFTVSLVQST